MKALFFGLTLLVHIALTVTIKLSGYFYLLIGIVLLSMLIGYMLKRMGTSLYAKDLGWGLFYGSITSMSIIIIIVLSIMWLFRGVQC
jgi:hypothetical protein